MIELRTERLRLVACPGDSSREGLERELAVDAAEWPDPELADLLPAYERRLAEDPGVLGWGPWVVVLERDRVVAGSAGFIGPPGEDATVELGYGIFERFRRRGLATEAARALAEWALDKRGVERVVAACAPDNAASIRVLEHIGMRRTGTRGDELLWELRGR